MFSPGSPFKWATITMQYPCKIPLTLVPCVIYSILRILKQSKSDWFDCNLCRYSQYSNIMGAKILASMRTSSL